MNESIPERELRGYFDSLQKYTRAQVESAFARADERVRRHRKDLAQGQKLQGPDAANLQLIALAELPNMPIVIRNLAAHWVSTGLDFGYLIFLLVDDVGSPEERAQACITWFRLHGLDVHR